MRSFLYKLIVIIFLNNLILLYFQAFEMEIPGGKKTHFRHLLYFAFCRNQKAAEAAGDICAVYGEDAIAARTAQNWFTKFKNGNFDLNDMPRSGRPTEFDEDHLKALLKEDGRQTCRDLAEKMNSNAMTVSRHLESIGFTQKLGAWVPHELTEKNKENRFKIGAQHLARHRATRGHKQRFLYRIVTGDEKWCLYVNMKQRKEWVASGETPNPRVKQDLHPKKTMICVWWDWEGLVHWEMLEKNKTVEKNLYIAQLHRVNEAIQQKRPDRQGQVILLHDNARPHVANIVKAALQELDWEVLQHPPYSPDLAPTDYHLFRSLSNQMRGVTFDTNEDLENWLNNFFESRPSDFWRDGINKLVERWEQVVNSEGEYIID